MLSREEFTRQLADRLKKIREKQKLSQEELADKAGLYRTYVGHIENARYSPSGYVLYKLIKALNVDPEELLPAT